MSYKVKLKTFQGPFDLLVYLIESARMNIYDIQVAEITSQYMDYMKQMEEADVTVSSEFMVLAAELIDLKSKMLLPRVNPEKEAGEPAEDPRRGLVTRILEYKAFRDISEMLAERELENRRIREKPQEDLSRFTGEPDEYLVMDIQQFVNAFNAFLKRKKKIAEIRERYEKVERQRITAERRREYIKSLFQAERDKVMPFEDLIPDKEDKYDVALSFTALMEMVKEQRLKAEQQRLFGEISVSATEHLNDAEPEDDKSGGTEPENSEPQNKELENSGT